MRTKQALTRGLFSLLNDNEFRRITVSDICLAAHVSRPTFYTYFEDKYSLLNYCTRMVLDDILKPLLPDDASDKQRLQQIFDQLFEYRQSIANCMFLGETISTEFGSIPKPVNNDVPKELTKLYKLGGAIAVFCWWSVYGKVIPREMLVIRLAELLE